MFGLGLWWSGFLTAVGLWLFWSIAVAVGRYAEKNGIGVNRNDYE